MADKKKRRARGEGSIRQRPNGSWEARFVTGIDPLTGKEIRRSVYGKSQEEVLKRKTEAIAALNKGTYVTPSGMTLAVWMNTWRKEYLVDIKDSTRYLYGKQID